MQKNILNIGCIENLCYDTIVKQFNENWLQEHYTGWKGAVLQGQIAYLRSNKTEKEMRSDIKKAMYAIIPQAVIPSGKTRKNDNVVALSGLVVTDFDHVSSDRNELERIYREQIEPKINELSIVWVFISPSGNGIKVISELRDEDTHEDTAEKILKRGQMRVAEALNLSDYYDECGVDPARACCLSLRDDTLYMAPDMFSREVRQIPLPLKNAVGSQQQKAVAERLLPTVAASQCTSDVTDIEREFYALIGGEPVEGCRHTKIMEWAKAAVYLTTSQQGLKSMLTPYGLDDKEIEDIASWVWTNTDKDEYPETPFKLKKAIAKVYESVDDMIERRYKQPPLPELPRAFQIFTDLEDKEEKKIFVFLSELPVMGTVMNNIESRYVFSYDGDKIARPDFMVFLYGDSGCGKGLAEKPYKYLTTEIENHDEQAKEKFAKTDYRDREFNHPFTQLYGDNNTKAALLENFAQNGGLATLMETPQIRGFINSFGAGKYADLSDYLLECFDRKKISSNRQGKEWLSARGVGALNLLAAGTPKEAREFLIPQFEEGLARRVLLYPFPKYKGFRQKKPGIPPSADDKKYLGSIMKRGMELSFDKNDNVRTPYYIDMDWINEYIEQWRDRMEVISYEMSGIDERKARYFFHTLMDSTAEIAFRASMLMYYLWGEDESAKTKTIEFFKWFADFIQFTKFEKLADLMPEQSKTTGQKQKIYYKIVYDLLPEEFTREQLGEALKNCDYPTAEVRNVLCKWKAAEVVDYEDRANTITKV